MDNSAAEYLESEGLAPYLTIPPSEADSSSSSDDIYAAVDPENRIPFPPDAADLARLRKAIRDRRVMTVLEFGVGYSTIVMADALAKNKMDFGDYAQKNLRRKDSFTLHTIDADSDFIELTRSNVPPHLTNFIEFHFSPV